MVHVGDKPMNDYPPIRLDPCLGDHHVDKVDGTVRIRASFDWETGKSEWLTGGELIERLHNSCGLLETAVESAETNGLNGLTQAWLEAARLAVKR
jgi:hypothetical protein